MIHSSASPLLGVCPLQSHISILVILPFIEFRFWSSSYFSNLSWLAGWQTTMFFVVYKTKGSVMSTRRGTRSVLITYRTPGLLSASKRIRLRPTPASMHMNGQITFRPRRRLSFTRPIGVLCRSSLDLLLSPPRMDVPAVSGPTRLPSSPGLAQACEPVVDSSHSTTENPHFQCCTLRNNHRYSSGGSKIQLGWVGQMSRLGVGKG